MNFKKQQIVADFSDKIAMSKMSKDVTKDMETAEAMKFNEFLKKCIPSKTGTDKEKFGACLLEFKNIKLDPGNLEMRLTLRRFELRTICFVGMSLPTRPQIH